MPFLRSEPVPAYTGHSGHPGRFESGLSHYMANNSTTLAAPLELNPDDLAQLDQDISTHAFKSGFPPRQPSPFDRNRVRIYEDKENYLSPAPNDYNQKYGARTEEIDRLVRDIAPPSSSDYPEVTPMLRRSTDEVAKLKAFTPPTSSSPYHLDKERAPLRNVDVNSSYFRKPVGVKSQTGSQSPYSEMQQIFEQRIDLIKETEAEKFAAAEIEYRRQINKLQTDYQKVLQRHDELEQQKETTERDLDRCRESLRAERHQRAADREAYEARIRDLQARIEDLQKKLRKYGSMSEDEIVRGYERKLAELERENDKRIAQLIGQFETEKQSALQIMKTKIKSEINLLVPRIRQQCQEAFSGALVRCQEQSAQKYREKYGSLIKRLKEEHQAEKRFIQKQAREQAEEERKEWQRKVKTHYEMKALEVKNECERRLLDRMRSKPAVSFAREPDSELYASDYSFL